MRARATMWFFDTADPIEVLRAVPPSDPEAAAALAHRLYPEQTAVARAPVPLAEADTSNGLHIGCYPGLTVVCSDELVVAHPGRLAGEWIRPDAMFVGLDPERPWGAYTIWSNGKIRRSFSATDVTILEDEGLPQVWERPFWAGERPMAPSPGVIPDPQSLPFDPQELADEANSRLLGFRLRATDPAELVDARRIMLCSFEIRDRAVEPEPGPAPEPAPAIVAPPRRRWFRRKRR